MTELLTSKEHFQEGIKAIGSIINLNKQLPDNIFYDDFTNYLFFNFDSIFADDFGEGLLSSLKKAGEKEFVFSMLTPNPEQYFSNFNKYAMVYLSVDSSWDDFFINSINISLSKNIADDLYTNIESAAYYSKSKNWVIYFDRGFEIGIFASRDSYMKDAVSQSFNKDLLFTVDEALENLMSLMYPDQKVPEDIEKAFKKNYPTEGWWQ